MSLSTWIQMSPRMKPGLESARLVAQLSHIQAIPHHGHKQLLVPTSSKKKEINIVLLQVFLRDPKEPHGHKMASLLHQDINDLSYEILVPLSGLIVMKVHWVLVMIWAGGGWVRAVLLCQSPVLETSSFFFFFQIKVLFWLLVSFFFPERMLEWQRHFPSPNFGQAGSSEPRSGLSLDLGHPSPCLQSWVLASLLLSQCRETFYAY